MLCMWVDSGGQWLGIKLILLTKIVYINNHRNSIGW